MSEYTDFEYTVSPRRNSSTSLPFAELTCTEVRRRKLGSPNGGTTSSPSLPDKSIVRHSSFIPLGKPDNVAFEVARGPNGTTAISRSSSSLAYNYSPNSAKIILVALRRFGLTTYGCSIILREIDMAIESSSQRGEGEIDIKIWKIITKVYRTDCLRTEEYYCSDSASLEDESNGCVICMEDFKQGQLVAELPCDHHFHEACILEWMKISHRCPFCRFLFFRR